jgi:hypothetical protein
MNLEAEKWSLLGKIHDYRFLLRWLGFALVVDLLLAVTTGTNLWTFQWAVVKGRPGLLLMAVLAYGVVETLGAAIVSWANYGLRKLTRHRGAFASDEALIKLLYLALRNIRKRWTLPIRDWKVALNRFTIQFEGRIPQL